MNEPQRLHALDNLRAIMMWLGIVLHVALNHIVGPSTAPWRDPQTTLAANLLIAFIHTFRMPVFFVLAGFFVALLIERRGCGGMFKHRLRRLGLPFVIFWPPIFVLTVVLAMLFVHRMERGTWGLDASIMPRPADGALLNTVHFWFLYLLLWFCAITALFGHIRVHPKIAQSFWLAIQRLGSVWWGILVLALPLALASASFRAGIVLPSGSFLPPWPEWLHSGVFFVFGLALFRFRDDLLTLLMRRRFAYATTGAVCFAAWLALYYANESQQLEIAHPNFWMGFLYSCSTWLWSFALIGGFLHHLSQPNKVLQYLADSSYWVYLVHMLATIGFGALLFSAPLSAGSKMILNMVATTAVGLLSYQLLVRRTAIGRLLNGRRPSE